MGNKNRDSLKERGGWFGLQGYLGFMLEQERRGSERVSCQIREVAIGLERRNIFSSHHEIKTFAVKGSTANHCIHKDRAHWENVRHLNTAQLGQPQPSQKATELSTRYAYKLEHREEIESQVYRLPILNNAQQMDIVSDFEIRA
jgi:hypothetical protein